MKEFVRQNLFVVICVGVTVLALVAIVFPYLQVGDLRANTLQVKKRLGEVQVAFTQHESPKQITKRQKQISDIQAAQERITTSAIQFTHRQPLLVARKVDDKTVHQVIFPNPTLNTERYGFHAAYRDSIGKWLEQLQAAAGASDAEIQAAIAKEEENMVKARTPAGGTARPLTPEEKKRIDEQVRRRLIGERAGRHRMYAGVQSFDTYFTPGEFVNIDRLSDQALWGAQLNWWIQQDLVNAIDMANSVRAICTGLVKGDQTEITVDDPNQKVFTSAQEGRLATLTLEKNANGRDMVRAKIVSCLSPTRILVEGRHNFMGALVRAPSTSVQQSAVKRLVRVDVDEQYYRGPGTSRQSSGSKGQIIALTRHQTGEKYDVLHYEFDVIIDVREIPTLVRALSRQNFHTVLSLSYGSLNAAILRGDRQGEVRAPTAPGEQGIYEFGPDPVVSAHFECEAVFMKRPLSWRENNEQAREKRRAFLEEHPEMILKVVRRGPQGKVLASYEQLRADPQVAKQLLEQKDANVEAIALYEDLMPSTVKASMAAPGPGARRNR